MWRSHVGEGAMIAAAPTIVGGRLPASTVMRSKQCHFFKLQKQFEQQVEMQTTLEEIGREVRVNVCAICTSHQLPWIS